MSGEKVSNRHPIFTADAWGFRPSEEKPEKFNKSPSRLFYVYLMAPAIALLAAITIYPFLWLIYMSLHKVKLGPVDDKWVGLKNYARLLSDAKYFDGWVLLAKYSSLCLTFEIIIGVLLAVVLNNSRLSLIHI